MRIICIVHVTTRVTAVRFPPHGTHNVSMTNDMVDVKRIFYNPKYDWILRRNSKTTNDFPYLKGTGCPPSVIMFISTVSNFFLQRHVQYRVEGLMHVPILFLGLVDYAKQRCFRVSNGNVFQYVAVYVHGVYVTIFQRKFAACFRVIVVVCYVCVGTQYLGQTFSESNR